MRLALLLTLLPVPTLAWQFSSVPVCTLAHEDEGATWVVTYDASRDQPYAIAITLAADAWPEAPVFGIVFAGPRGLSIGTDRHVRSDAGRTLTVSDTGFGNVLDGLEFNGTATAVAGETAVMVPLDGAAPQVQAFRACAEGGVA
mgnify:FL=1